MAKGIIVAEAHRQLQVNHFPRTYEITRKDRLAINIQRMQQIHGIRHFDFIPKSFRIPSDTNDFRDYATRERGTWIVKPCASSRGRGIYLASSVSEINLDEACVIARYIDNPLLVDGFKFDVRIYVAVTSFDPLRIYVYKEGLTRFTTERCE